MEIGFLLDPVGNILKGLGVDSRKRSSDERSFQTFFIEEKNLRVVLSVF